MQDTVSKRLVFTSLTALKRASAALFPSHLANTSFTGWIRNLPHSSRVVSNFKHGKTTTISRELSGFNRMENSISNKRDRNYLFTTTTGR